MSDYAIYADKLGVREDVPSVLLSEVFLTTESRNIHDEYKNKIAFYVVI